MEINIERLNIKDSEFHDNAAVIRNETRAAESDENAAILSELRKTREQLEKTEPLIADTVAALEQAVQEKDKPKIGKLLANFSTGTAKAALVKVASDALLSWMGIK